MKKLRQPEKSTKKLRQPAMRNSNRVPRRFEPTEGVKKVWLDCDPGHDDAMAIILAGFTPNIHLLGISTVGCNLSLEKTTLNACRMVAVTSLDVKVYAGQETSLYRTVFHESVIHGKTGLDGTDFLGDVRPPAGIRGTVKGVIAMATKILEQHEKVWIIATGSLTNIAVALTLYPEIVTRLHGICLMGGCLGIGNRGPVQEFNILVDPEAAKIVFEFGKPPTSLQIVMVPLEVTHTVIATPEIISTISDINPNGFIPTLCVQLLSFFASTYRSEFGFRGGPPLHDPCAVAYVIDPSLFEVDYMNVEIETGSPLTPGQTVCDVWCSSGRPQNVFVCRQIDVEKFWTLMVRSIATCATLNAQHVEIPPDVPAPRVAARKPIRAKVSKLRLTRAPPRPRPIVRATQPAAKAESPQETDESEEKTPTPAVASSNGAKPKTPIVYAPPRRRLRSNTTVTSEMHLLPLSKFAKKPKKQVEVENTSDNKNDHDVESKESKTEVEDASNATPATPGTPDAEDIRVKEDLQEKEIPQETQEEENEKKEEG